MENPNNYIQENKIFELYFLNIDIDYLKPTIYTEIRESSIQILVQDINDWRKSRKIDNKNYNHQYQEYCSILKKVILNC